MDQERKSLKVNDVWGLVQLPQDKASGKQVGV